MKDLAAWLDSFAVPLVGGGAVRVRGPVSRRDYQGLSFLEHRALADARAQVGDELLLHLPAPELDPASVALLGGVANLLFLAHPHAWPPRVSDTARSRVAALAIAELGAVLPPENPAELVARHTIVHRLVELGRTDVEVTYWAGRALYQGSEPPVRLLRWAKVRRVRHERRRVILLDELATLDEGRAVATSLVRALFLASPLTALLQPERVAPPFVLSDVIDYLRWAPIARLVVDRALGAGLPTVAPLWMKALPSLCQGRSPERVELACNFLCHLQLVDLANAPAGADAHRLRLEGLVQRHEGLRDFFGLFAACAEERLERPADLRGGSLARDQPFVERIAQHARVCRALVGSARLRELTTLIERGLGGARDAGQLATSDVGSLPA